MSGKGGDVEITKQRRRGPAGPGRLEIRAGQGSHPKPGGDIVFTCGDGKEAFRIESDGKVLIRGKHYGYDRELYQAMCDFFKGAKTEYPTHG